MIETVPRARLRGQEIPFVVPAWARGVVSRPAMEREQWGRFTDFGVTLFDSAGRQLGEGAAATMPSAD